MDLLHTVVDSSVLQRVLHFIIELYLCDKCDLAEEDEQLSLQHSPFHHDHVFSVEVRLFALFV